MEREDFHLQVVTPERAVFSDDVEAVVLPGADGQLGILPGHIPLLTKLDIGEMVVRQGGEQRRFFISRGFAEVLGDRVRVMAEECEGVDEIDIEQAREDIRDAEKEVEKLEESDEDDELIEKYRERLEKNRKRLMMSGDMDDE